LAFSNDDIKKAIKVKYFVKPEDAIEIHKVLAEYYLAIPELSDRKVEELPYQLLRAQKYDQLCDCLCDLQVFDKLYSPYSKYDLFEYWRELEKVSPTKYDVSKYYSLDENYTTVSRKAAGMIMSDLLYKLGCFLEEVSKYQAAEKVFVRSRDHYRNSSQYLEVAKVTSELAKLYHTQGRYKEAETMLDSCLEIYLKQKGEDCMEVCVNLNRLGSLYTTQKRYKESKTILQRAWTICERCFGPDSLIAADIAYSLGLVHMVEEARFLDIAEQWFTRALKMMESHYGDKHPEVATILNRLGTLYMEQDQFNDAEECLKRSLSIREKLLGANHSRVSQTLRTLMSLYEMQERFKEALETGHRALEITKSIFGNEHWHVSAILLRLGSLYYSTTQNEQGKAILSAALAMREKQFGANHENVEEVKKLIQFLEQPVVIPPRVPPPPPPPLLGPITTARAPPPPPGAKGPPSRKPGEIPLPPPPPPTFHKPSPFQHSAVGGYAGAAGPEDGDIHRLVMQQISHLKKNKGPAKQDRSDARRNALAMMGAQERKIHFAKKKAK